MDTTVVLFWLVAFVAFAWVLAIRVRRMNKAARRLAVMQHRGEQARRVGAHLHSQPGAFPGPAI